MNARENVLSVRLFTSFRFLHKGRIRFAGRESVNSVQVYLFIIIFLILLSHRLVRGH